MKRYLISCVLFSLLICCGCSAQGKPEPIHLDNQDGGALSFLLNDPKGDIAEQKADGEKSQILGDLLGENTLVPPEVEGYDTQLLYNNYKDLEQQVKQAAEDASVDRDQLRQQIQQLSGVVSMSFSQLHSDTELSEADSYALGNFYQQLSNSLTQMLEDLKK